ncbi:hypothetical protein L2U69_05405 [Zavarzinia compransoris]|uniref:hypothetical protein n=1 Tax=Zavarzinia marina TaxID=2911065 RepID=UPI001F19409C|nr:hypothetical protein [Zavarzinia marina]MCF4165070.1 hypothetical protein [Zavarzinia marina]
MTISYFGHSALPRRQTQDLIDALRRRNGDLFVTRFHLHDATPLGPFGAEIARDFGIEARSRFMIAVTDKERLDGLDDALDRIYRAFGAGRLIISWELDRVRPPYQTNS